MREIWLARSTPGEPHRIKLHSARLLITHYPHEQAYVSLKHEGDKVLVYERAGLLFIFNFHPTNSYTDYRVGIEEPGEYKVVLSSDEKRFGGYDNISLESKYFTTPMEWNGRKNFLQVVRSSVLLDV